MSCINLRQIWEELGLPELDPQEPWYGYTLGMWPEDLDMEARMATEGDHAKVAEILKRTRVELSEGETLDSMRAEWGRTNQGRVV